MIARGVRLMQRLDLDGITVEIVLERFRPRSSRPRLMPTLDLRRASRCNRARGLEPTCTIRYRACLSR